MVADSGIKIEKSHIPACIIINNAVKTYMCIPKDRTYAVLKTILSDQYDD